MAMENTTVTAMAGKMADDGNSMIPETADNIKQWKLATADKTADTDTIATEDAIGMTMAEKMTDASNIGLPVTSDEIKQQKPETTDKMANEDTVSSTGILT